MSGQRNIAPSPVAGVVSITPFRRDFTSNVIVLLAIPYYFCSCPISLKCIIFLTQLSYCYMLCLANKNLRGRQMNIRVS